MPVPFVEAAILGQASFPVSQVPFAEAGRGVAGALQQLADRDLPGDQPLRQAGRHRLHRAGADRMATGHQRRAGRYAVALDVEVEGRSALGPRVRRSSASGHRAGCRRRSSRVRPIPDCRRGISSMLGWAIGHGSGSSERLAETGSVPLSCKMQTTNARLAAG